VEQGLTADGALWAFSTGYFSNWHPITWISYMTDVEYFGHSAKTFHTINIVLHALVSALVFAALISLTGALFPSALVAFLFALHPLHVESVAWVSERKDLLSAGFWMLALLAYGRYVAKPALWRYGMVAGCFVFGLLSKPMAVTLPFVLLLLDYWPLRRFEGTGAWRKVGHCVVEKVPLFVLSAASSAITYAVQEAAGTVRTASYDLPVRAANALVAYADYLWKAALPRDLAVLYPHPGEIAPAWALAGSAGALAALTLFAALAGGKRPYVRVGWLWYLGCLVPVIGIVQVGAQSMADRYTYIPLLGIFIAAAYLLHRKLEGTTRPLLWKTIITAGVIAALTPLTRAQLRHWTDTETLFRRAVTVTSENYRAHQYLGVALREKGEVDEALTHFEKAIAIRPDFYKPYMSLGSVAAARGEAAEAEAYYKEALARNPASAETAFRLGGLARERGEFDEAITWYESAIEVDTDHMGSRTNLGIALAESGRADEAINALLAALEVEPGHVDTLFNLGIAFAQLGRLGDAAGYLSQAASLAPEAPDIQFTLAVLLTDLGRLGEARSHYEAAIRAKPDHGGAKQALRDLYGSPPDSSR
jgi:tetratricopeptide (TPR) repeat protein